jgi:hypothetical protein
VLDKRLSISAMLIEKKKKNMSVATYSLEKSKNTKINFYSTLNPYTILAD